VALKEIVLDAVAEEGVSEFNTPPLAGSLLPHRAMTNGANNQSEKRKHDGLVTARRVI
jgi:hypothetical protein